MRADKNSLPVVPHVWGTAISFYASLQLTATLPERPNAGPAPFPYLECDQSGYPMLNVYGEAPLNADGTISLPDAPGIGIDPAAADFAQWIVDQWSLAA